MQYIKLLNKKLDIFPIFGKCIIKNPVFLSMDDNSTWMQSLSNEQIKNQEIFNKLIYDFGLNNNSDLIISGFLEKRELMFTSLGFKQMIEEKRFYHLGLDLSITNGTIVYVPLDGVVYESDIEQGEGNYGGYIILKHNVGGFIFYSLYGHQDNNNLPKVGTYLNAGDELSIIGNFSHNGGYFHHLHFQLITQEGIDNGFINKGYIDEENIKNINKFILDPNYLFRY